jgi:hypothetical protein
VRVKQNEAENGKGEEKGAAQKGREVYLRDLHLWVRIVTTVLPHLTNSTCPRMFSLN